MTTNQQRQIETRVNDIQQRPKVGVFIDLDGLLADKDDLQDDLIADRVRTFIKGVGRFCMGTVYYSYDIVKTDEFDHRAWNSRGFQKVLTHEDGFTSNDLNLDLLLDVHATAMRKKMDTLVLVVGTTKYNELVRRVIAEGVAVVLVSNYPREYRTLPKDSCIYVPTYTVFNGEREHRDDVVSLEVEEFDPEEFDYSGFIRLLATSESKMPFVGINYFVKRVMWRLGGPFGEVYLCQQLFQAAKEKGIVEVYERENINSSDNMVSACKLDRTNPLVEQVMEELDEAITPKSPEVQVTVDIGESPNDAVGAAVSSQPTA